MASGRELGSSRGKHPTGQMPKAEHPPSPLLAQTSARSREGGLQASEDAPSWGSIVEWDSTSGPAGEPQGITRPACAHVTSHCRGRIPRESSHAELDFGSALESSEKASGFSKKPQVR